MLGRGLGRSGCIGWSRKFFFLSTETDQFLERSTDYFRVFSDIETLATFETAGAYALAAQAPTRYAVRQVLDQELQKAMAVRETAARQARFKAGSGGADYSFDDDKENRVKGKTANAQQQLRLAAEAGAVKKDFFGRVIAEAPRPLGDASMGAENRRRMAAEQAAKAKVWVTFNEGLNNAVRKPISLDEFLAGL